MTLLYHGTKSCFEASILANGLIAAPDYILTPDDRPGINFVDSPDNDLLPNRVDLIIAVDASNIDQAKLEDYGSGWFRYFDSIPNKYLLFTSYQR